MTTTRSSDYKVQIGFGGGLGSRFTIGVSTIGGVDVFATDWTEYFNGTYDDVSDDIAEGGSITISRGLDSKLAALESGKCSFQLFKPSNRAFYDPNDASSPLNNGTVTPGFVPMRPVRVLASNDGWSTTETLFYGFIRTAAYDPDTGVCTIQAEDLLYWMSRLENPVIGSSSGLSSSDIAGIILDSFGFTGAAMRSLSTTPALTGLTFSADGTVTTLDLLKAVLDAEQGRMFIDGAGVFHFEDRYARDRRTSSLYTFTSELIGVDSRADADTIGNRVTVTRTGGTPQVAQDLTSEHAYGIGDVGSIDTAYLATDAAALDLANLILMRAKDPHPPQQATIDNQDAATMTSQLAVEYQDRVTISGVDGYVEQLTHVITPGGIALHTTTLLISEVPAFHVFEIGVSTLVDPAATTGDILAA